MRSWLGKGSFLLALSGLAVVGLALPDGRETPTGSPAPRPAESRKAVNGSSSQTPRATSTARFARPPTPDAPVEEETRPHPLADHSRTMPDGTGAPLSEPDLATRLDRAIQAAERERGFFVSSGVVGRVLERGEVRILFPVRDEDAATRVAHLLDPNPSSSKDSALRIFPLVGQAAARVDGEGLLAVVTSGATEHVELDVLHRPSLASTIPLIRADEAHAFGDDGSGRVVAVLDTGVDLDHPMFAGRIVEEACFSLLRQCPEDSAASTAPGSAEACPHPGCHHGTSVAAIAMGRAPGEGIVGVAPSADLLAIQIFSDVGGSLGAYTSDIVAGLQHVLALSASYPIDVVNLSLGGTVHESAEVCDAQNASTYAVVAQLREAGIVTVAAAGNEGRTDGVTSPGCLSNVLGVGATDDADVVAGFSNSSDLLSLLAPGVSIETAAVGGGTHWTGGTSMATPHASGAVALIRTRFPLATPGEIENAIALTGIPVYDPRGDVTLPRLDVQAAIDLLQAAATPPPEPDPPTPPAPEPDVSEDSSTANAPSTGGGGGGGACGLVGLEPFLLLAGIRIKRFVLG